ncbi:MAG: TIGR00725 family protein [Thermoplasmatota archaeon]
MKRPMVAVIGSGDTRPGDRSYTSAEEIGRSLVDNGFRVLTGGLRGIMEAASKGAHLSEGYIDGSVIGILPGQDPALANEYVDIAIPTGLGIARNTIITNADAIIAVGGGSGTLSEMAFAWQKGKLIIALDVPGWSGELGGRKLDERNRHPNVPDDRVYMAGSAREAVGILLDKLPLYTSF